MADRKLPKFESEAEEARWWFEHRAEIGKEIAEAAKQGRLGVGSLGRRARRLREAGVVEEKDKTIRA